MSRLKICDISFRETATPSQIQSGLSENSEAKSLVSTSGDEKDGISQSVSVNVSSDSNSSSTYSKSSSSSSSSSSSFSSFSV